MTIGVTVGFGEVASGRASSGNLDQFFRDWATVGSRRVGVPRWLGEATIDASKAGRTRQDRWGIRFTPDALGRTKSGERLVIELKYAPLYEPLALAEALHHAFELATCTDAFPPVDVEPAASKAIAVIVSQANAWLRSSVDALRGAGVGRDVARYVEAIALDVDGFDEPVLWFEEYLNRDALTSSVAPPLPASVLEQHAASKASWYQRTDESGVFVSSDAKLEDGCLPHDALRAVFAPLPSGGWLVWKGNERLARGSSEYAYHPA